MESETAIEMQQNCQTNAKYNIRQITNTITNTKYQTANKCQTDDLLPECHQKFILCIYLLSFGLLLHIKKTKKNNKMARGAATA